MLITPSKPQLVGFGGRSARGPKDLQLSYVANSGTESESSASSHTSNSISFGANVDDYDKYVIATYHQVEAGGGFTVNSMTIDGNTATLEWHLVTTGSLRVVIAIGIYGPITSTSGTCTVNFDSSRSGDTTWSTHRLLAGQGGSFSMTVQDFIDAGGPDPSGTIDCAAGGVILAGGSSVNADPISWTGITENYDHDVNTGEQMSGGGQVESSAQTNKTITFNCSSETLSCMTAVAWDPPA